MRILPFYKIQEDGTYYLDSYKLFSYTDVKSLYEKGVTVDFSFDKPRKTKGNILFLEPHPDDIALSAGQYLLMKISEGFSCHIISFFSKASLATFPWNSKIEISQDKYFSLRVLENDLLFREFLHENLLNLNLPQALLRGYLSVSDRVSNEDREVIKYIKSKVKKYVDENGIEEVISPLGIGYHVDHLITYDVALSINHKKTIFYLDYHYANSTHLTNKRLDEILNSKKIKFIYYPADEKSIDFNSTMLSFYKSQFDDIDKHQWISLLKERFRACQFETLNTDQEYMYKMCNLK